jgi:hypothetical protein
MDLNNVRSFAPDCTFCAQLGTKRLVSDYAPRLRARRSH